MKRRLIVIACGQRKRNHSCTAGQMYIGSYHKSLQRAARCLVTPDNILILSAKHGLLKLTDIIQPYEQRIDKPGCVKVETLRTQVMNRDLINTDVTVLGGARYVKLARAVWPDAHAPLEGLGFGKSMQKLKRLCGN